MATRSAKKPSLSCVVVLVNSNLKTVPLKKKSMVETSPHLFLPPDDTSCPAFEEITLRAGIKNYGGYKMIATWPCSEGNHLRMYAKNDGRVNLLNQFRFCSPADNQQFYGVCLIICVKDETNQVIHMDKSMFQEVYSSPEQLELQKNKELHDVDDEGDDEDNKSTDGGMKRSTSCGYKLDGFVVGEDDAAKCSDNDEDEHDVKVSATTSNASVTKKTKKDKDKDKDKPRVDAGRRISSATAKRHAAAAATAAAISLNTDASIEILAELVAEDYI
jgi:hypothetical protein